jgi:hypothetical protein
MMGKFSNFGGGILIFIKLFFKNRYLFCTFDLLDTYKCSEDIPLAYITRRQI